MSKGSKQQYKQYSINTIQQACLSLAGLISGMLVNIEKYKEYSAEVEVLLKNSHSKYIPAKEYDDINDKLLYRQREMLKLCADHQNSSFSYIELRKILEKRGFLTDSLSNELTKILNEMLDVRNWTFHNPQSLMVAALEVAKKEIPDVFKEIAQITPQLNPILVRKIDKYEIIMLVSLAMHTQRRIEQFNKIIQSMKRDYQKMYDSSKDKSYVMTSVGFSSEVQYVDKYEIARLDDYSSDVSQISMAIQKSKYDGTDEKFKESIIRLKNGYLKDEEKSYEINKN